MQKDNRDAVYRAHLTIDEASRERAPERIVSAIEVVHFVTGQNPSLPRSECAEILLEACWMLYAMKSAGEDGNDVPPKDEFYRGLLSLLAYWKPADLVRLPSKGATDGKG